MSYCHVSSQIAQHCNEPEEVFCPDCGGNMAFDDDYKELLICMDCGCTIDTDQDLN